jgi:hypothetical protein
LGRTIFTRSEAARIELFYRFSRPSVSFGYVLSIKQGSSWTVIRKTRKTGNFKGSRTTTVSRLFAGKPVRRGSYRLRLSADTNTRVVAFRVT